MKAWEKVCEDPVSITDRIEVEGGWLYRSTMTGPDSQWGNASMCFVPDVAHWTSVVNRVTSRAPIFVKNS